MIEEVRKATKEKTVDMKKHFHGREDQNIHDRYAREVYLHLMKTRRSLQYLFDFVQAQDTHNPLLNRRRESGLYKAEMQQGRLDFISFFTGVQRAASSIVSGALILRKQGKYQPSENTAEFDIVSPLLGEAQQLVTYCKNYQIPCFNEEFLRRVLAYYGLDEFKKLVEDEEFSILKFHPALFEQAILHQQGDPSAFLRSKANFARKTVDELQLRFEGITAIDDEVFIKAALEYHPRFSNPHDYVFNYLKQKDPPKKKKRRLPDPEL